MSERVTGLGPGSEVTDVAKFDVLPVAASDLVAWYPFRSGTGEDITAGDSNFGDTTDFSATVNGATFQASGGVTDIQTGANSGAFDFDGTDDTLDLGTVADSDQSLTVMTWVEFDVTDGARFLSKFDASQFNNGSVVIDSQPDGTLRFFATNNGSATILSSSTTVSTGQFVHAAGRYDFGTGEITQFINGNPEGTKTVGQLPAHSSQPWRIGASNPTTSNSDFLDGTADGTRIYQASLSDSQINQIYLNTEP